MATNGAVRPLLCRETTDITACGFTNRLDAYGFQFWQIWCPVSYGRVGLLFQKSLSPLFEIVFGRLSEFWKVFFIGALRSFSVIQGQRNWYQSKVLVFLSKMRLPSVVSEMQRFVFTSTLSFSLYCFVLLFPDMYSFFCCSLCSRTNHPNFFPSSTF